VVPLRPLGLGELLDGAIKIIRRYPRPTLGLSAAIALVVTLVNVAFVLSLDTSLGGSSSPFGAGSSSPFGDTTSSTDVSTTFPVGAAAAMVVGLIIKYLGGLVLTGALVAVVGKAILGQPAPAGEVWAAVRPRLLALLGLSILSGLITAAPAVVGIGLAIVLVLGAGPIALLLGIPLGIAGVALSAYLGIRLVLAAPALVLEKAGIRTALRRSGALVKDSWWRVLGILLLAGIITGTITAIISLPISIGSLVLSGGDSASSAYLIAQQVGAGLASVLVAPFSAGVYALLYVDRRMRAEGLDVALHAAVTSSALV
jgi:hypothetical protein